MTDQEIETIIRGEKRLLLARLKEQNPGLSYVAWLHENTYTKLIDKEPVLIVVLAYEMFGELYWHKTLVI